MTVNDPDLEAFHKAAQTLKLYRRAEIESERGDSLIEDLYVDPLPNDHVYRTIIKPNTTFIVGRKGTGKSTVFQRAQRGLLHEKHILSTYIDIKTVFESAQTDPEMLSKLTAASGALSPAELQKLRLMRGFLKAVIAGIRDDMQKQLNSTWKKRFKETFTGTFAEVFAALDEFLEDLDRSTFLDVQGIRTSDLVVEDTSEVRSDVTGSAGISMTAQPGLKVGVDETDSTAETSRSLAKYSTILLRVVDVKELLTHLREILAPMGVKHLFCFVDDFSELPAPAMQAVVDVLLCPLNNWSDELVKFKVAAYPGRIYYGDIDRSKIDEISLDTYSLYGGMNVAEMETKAIDFTRRLIATRLQHFGTRLDHFLDPHNIDERNIWRALFFASMGNPRILGYLLFFIYETQLIYGRPLTLRSVRSAAQRYYEDKIESYFGTGRFLHESFEERSGIYSLKELLEQVVSRARDLRYYDRSSHIRDVKSRRGISPSSHFYVSQRFDPILATLELNFFLTKYYVQSDRDGHRVSIYALNFGLCEKYSIAFGRPEGTRENRAYFVERIFDYSPILQGWIASNQEIRCDACGTIFEDSVLPALRMYRMQCPSCHDGICRITNTSRKYDELLRDVDESALLPETELGILQTLASENRAMFPGEIAGELDVSPQLVGWRGKRLAERALVTRHTVKGRRQLGATDLARSIYFSDQDVEDLDI